MAAFDILNSCRFNSIDSARTTQTFSASDRTLWTLAFWVKRCAAFGTAQHIFSAGAAASDQTNILFDANDKLQYQQVVASSEVEDIVTDTVLRDPSTWYHIVVAYDSDNGTPADRLKIYINGVLQALTGTDISSGRTSDINAADSHAIGREEPDADEYLDAYLADVIFVDGAQEAATVFGQFAANGAWEAIDPAPTYGTNGFRLAFQTDTAFGDDTSGMTNDFSDSGLATNDQHTDTPSHNHAVINHLCGLSANTVVSDGNRVIKGTSGGGAWGFRHATFFLESGKWYWEVDITGGTVALLRIGLAHQAGDNMSEALGATEYTWGLENSSGTVLRTQHAGSPTTLTDTGTLQSGDYVMVAYDADTGEIWFGLNGSWLDSGDPAAGTGEQFTADRFPLTPAFGVNKTSENLLLRSDSADFEGTIPTGFNALTTTSLALPIDTPQDYFDTALYAGNGTAIGSGGKAITGLAFQPDLVWIKNRDTTDQHIVTDVARGVTNFLTTDAQDVEVTDTEALSTFDSGGFTVGDNVQVNTNTENYIAWCWKEAVLPGLDIFIHTGTGAAHTQAHNLTVIPDTHISKRRSSPVQGWLNYAGKVLNTGGDIETDPADEHLSFDTTQTLTTTSAAFNNTEPDASNITVGAAFSNLETYVTYVWASIEGFSKIDAYAANGNADGLFVWCGFRPKLVIIKRTDNAQSWSIHDGTLDVTDPRNVELLADTTAAETSGSTNTMDFWGTGFKLRTNDVRTNGSTGEFTFMAFAELPFALASTGPPLPPAGAVTLTLSVAAKGGAKGDAIMLLNVAGRGGAKGAPTMALIVGATATNAMLHGNAAVTMVLSVAATDVNYADGAPVMALSVASTAHITSGGDVILTLVLAVTATEEHPLRGSPAIPVPATNGIYINSPLLTSTIAIPVIEVDGIVDTGLTGVGTLILPGLTLDASMGADATLVLPVPQVVATMHPGNVLTGTSIPVPRVGLDAAMSDARVLSGTIPLVQVKTNGVLVDGGVMTATLAIPAPSVSASILAGQTGDTPLEPLHSFSGTQSTGAKYCP